jgi:hypothetical protein
MDVVTLPVVWPSVTVSDALARMEEYERAGVIRHNATADSYRLLFVRDLHRALDAGTPSVAQVEGGSDILILDAATATAFGVDAVRPHRTLDQAEKMLDARSVGYALLAAGWDEAMILTRHELYKENLTSRFKCNGTPMHIFPEPYVRLGDQCPEYPLCSGTGSTPPTIVSA